MGWIRYFSYINSRSYTLISYQNSKNTLLLISFSHLSRLLIGNTKKTPYHLRKRKWKGVNKLSDIMKRKAPVVVIPNNTELLSFLNFKIQLTSAYGGKE